MSQAYNDPASTGFSYNNLNQMKSLTPPSTAEQSLTYLGSGQSTLTGLGSNTLQNSALGITKQTSEAGSSYYARTPAGLMVDERLPGSTSYNPIYDSQGDVIGLLNTSGTLAQTVRYGPYGENTTAAGATAYSATNDPFLYQGGYHLAGGNASAGNVPNNLYHYGQRYYDPTTGRWTQQDPVNQISDPNQADRYAFVGDDPINAYDPSGESLVGEIEEAAEDGAKVFSDVSPIAKKADDLFTLKCVIEARAHNTGPYRSTLIIVAPGGNQKKYIEEAFKCLV